ncbi:endonuclease domain-containing protein, partial [Escherichia coli]|uniref:endonuclease domain-containing protein n=1 Tax=Escherichia coli TaxID=562 RepID=UPI0028DE41C7
LKDRRLAGWKFVRQAPIGPYFADFLCREARVVVEVDGGQHSGSLHDIRRDATMARAGYRVIRFWNAEVLGSMESVLEGIL